LARAVPVRRADAAFAQQYKNGEEVFPRVQHALSSVLSKKGTRSKNLLELMGRQMP